MKKLFGILSLSVLLFSTFAPSFTYANEVDNNDIINLFSDLLNTYGMETSCEVGTEYMSGDYKGVTTENCGIKITEYNGTSKDIVIPEEMNGYAVKEIGEDVFKQKDITSVEIPDTVEIIGTGAFNHSNFANNYIINLPNKLERIEKDAFKTSNLSGFNELPEGLKFIGDSAFSNYERITIATSNLNSIKDVIIPNTVEYIGEYAFAGNPMDKIIIGNSVKEIGNYAFQGHRQKDITTVTELSIPDSVEKIGMSAFYENRHLHTVNIGSGNGMIKIMPYAFSSCGIKNFEINKDTIYLYSGGNYRGGSFNPYENIKITTNKIIRDGNYVLLGSSNGKYGYQHANLILSGNAFSGLISQNWRGDSLYLKNITFPESVTGLTNGTSNYSLINNFSGTLIIPGHIKSIGNNTFNGNSYLKNLIFEEGVEEIDDEAFYMSNNIENIEFSSTIKSIGNKAFAYLNKAKNLTIPGNIKKIGNNAFESAIILKNLNLGDGIEEIGEKAFFQINKDINGIYIPDSIKTIGLNAFCRDTLDSVNKVYVIDESRITGYVTKDVPQEWIDNETCMNFIRRYKIDFTGDSNLITIPERQIVDLNGNATEPNVGKTNGYEFLGWYEENSETPFDFNTPVTEDKTLYAHGKSLKEKAEETTTENVVYTNETTVTIGDDIQEEPINNSSTINLVSKEIETEEVKAEEEKITVQESEIKVTSDKTVEYEGGLEVYLEKTENVGTKNEVTEKVEGTIKFSSPVAVKIPITSNTETVKVQVKHNGEEFGYKGLTTNPVNNCVNGVAENDKYDGENIKVTNNNGDKYVLIYTCSASTFVAYTENTKPAAPSPAAGGGRTITPTKQESKATEQEHNSADTNKDTNTTKEETKSNNKESSKSIEGKIEKISPKALTRGELAVFSDILTEIFPKLTEGKKNINEYCSTYTDYEEFSAKEQKAVAKLCRLAIMGINEDDQSPLETFRVNNLSTNEEFIKVVNRMTDKFSDDELKDLKSALSSLEENKEDNLVFGTVVDVFKKIKELFN